MSSRTFVLGVTVAAWGLFASGCGGSGAGGGGAGGSVTSATGSGPGVGTGSGTASGTASTSSGTGGPCATDPLKTGLVAQQTGVSVDAFDCEILTASAKYAMPDPMIVKAIIYVESRFDHQSVGCPNQPCGVPSGWASNETGCFGLMQIVPACGGYPSGEGLLGNGHPDLATDTGSSDWANSVFNPAINIDLGIYGLMDNRAQEKTKFPGCTEDQYTMMAIGDYNSYGSTQSCTVVNQQYDDLVLAAYKQYAMAASYPAHNY
jgi:hypothetical protein